MARGIITKVERVVMQELTIRGVWSRTPGLTHEMYELLMLYCERRSIDKTIADAVWRRESDYCHAQRAKRDVKPPEIEDVNTDLTPLRSEQLTGIVMRQEELF